MTAPGPILGVDPGLQVTGLCGIIGKRIIYRGSIRTPEAWSDQKRRQTIARDIAAKVLEIGPLAAVWVESYEYQGPRTHTKNAIRCSLLVGQILGQLDGVVPFVGEVTRTEWGRALGCMTNLGRDRRLHRMTGLALKNDHERDAGAIALFGQESGRQFELIR